MISIQNSTLFYLNNVESDGRIYNKIRDPPGQNSVYIPPGDPKKELYRLSTFLKFPEDVPVNPNELAAAGFIYTGFKDRVKCFSCGQTVDNWTSLDDVWSVCWHKEDCLMAAGNDHENISIFSGGIIGRNNNVPSPRRLSQVDRRSHAAHSRQAVANENPNQSRNSQISSNSIHAGSSQPQNYHPPAIVRTSSQQDFVRNFERENTEIRQPVNTGNASTPPGGRPLPSSSFQGSSARDDEGLASLLINFPCLHPASPHMRSEEMRFRTFDSRWPAHKIHATPREIAKTGMMFLGKGDRVKCWYCNGGLQNWELDDDPWFEHAKWFPDCEFVLQQKGPAYVHNIVCRFPNLNRPVMRTHRQTYSSMPPANLPSPPAVIDPQVELRKKRQEVNNHLKSELVNMAKNMGFSQSLIKKAIEKRLDEDKGMYKSLEDLVDDILAMSDTEDTKTEPSAALLPANQARSTREQSLLPGTSEASGNIAETSLSFEERLKELQDRNQCKICLDGVAEVVFIPCGHLCSCMRCAGALRVCPICRTRISKAIRTYLS